MLIAPLESETTIRQAAMAAAPQETVIVGAMPVPELLRLAALLTTFRDAHQGTVLWRDAEFLRYWAEREALERTS